VQDAVPFNTLQTVSLARWKGGHEDDSFRPLARAAQALIDRGGGEAEPPDPLPPRPTTASRSIA
jgi:hypothetical protein